MRGLEQFIEIIDANGDDQQAAKCIGHRVKRGYFLDKKEV